MQIGLLSARVALGSEVFCLFLSTRVKSETKGRTLNGYDYLMYIYFIVLAVVRVRHGDEWEIERGRVIRRFERGTKLFSLNKQKSHKASTTLDK